jgi:hypothetical protein
VLFENGQNPRSDIMLREVQVGLLEGEGRNVVIREVCQKFVEGNKVIARREAIEIVAPKTEVGSRRMKMVAARQVCSWV